MHNYTVMDYLCPMKKVRISVVSYLNAVPFRHALLNYEGKHNWEIETDIPSVCADKLINKTVDMGLIPVAEIKRVPNGKIISNYCIAADGPVKSVLLLSRVPLPQVKIILLDYQSRTSVKLCKLLAGSFWKINPVWKQTEQGYESAINNETAGVVIGDRAIELSDKFEYVYDLSEEWKKNTGLPFVFACWVANKPIDETTLTLFDQALEEGIDNRLEILNKENIHDHFRRDYILNTICYKMNEEYRKSIDKFLLLSEKLV